MKATGWTREPLVHFLIGGALIFGLFAWRGAEVDPASRSITVDRAQQAQLALLFERTMGRAPTDAELDSQMERFIRDEVLYREALRLGLDRGDAVVRRRMAQKMDMLASARAETATADEAVLRTWYEENRTRFAPETSYTFDQLWFEKEDAAAAALLRLEEGANWQRLGGRISLPSSVSGMAGREVTDRFGLQFAESLQQLDPSGEWSAPLPSGLGWHLVRLSGVDPGQVPPFEQVKDEVQKDWRTATIAARKEAAYQLLREAYSVDIER